jgi:hypothetical protein
LKTVAGSATKLLGRSFLPFADFAAINDDVMLAHRTVDPDGAEGKVVKRMCAFLRGLVTHFSWR